MAPPECVVLDPCGVVIHVEGGALTHWLGHRLEDANGATAALRETGAALVREQGFFRRRLTGDGRFELIVLEAVPLRRAHTPVAELLARTMDAFLQQARAADVELHTERASDVPPSIFVDGEKIAWALGTLVGSSLRHAVRGKVLPARVDVRVSCSGDDLRIVVEDTGPGMPLNVARWLFTHDPATGKTSGTALRLVADVITAHRGDISAASDAGRGAQFTMRIPRR